jgi:tripartite-type tricarboxylate transporter receptor subunit TctC
MTRMVLMPPKVPAESIAILRKAFDGLSRDQDFLQDAISAMRFQPRFEVGEAGEKIVQAGFGRLTGSGELPAQVHR